MPACMLASWQVCACFLSPQLLPPARYSPDQLEVLGCAPVPSPEELGGFIPSPRFPSDHLAVCDPYLLTHSTVHSPQTLEPPSPCPPHRWSTTYALGEPAVSGQVRSGSGQARPGQARPARSGQVRPGRARPGQARAGQVRSDQAGPGQARMGAVLLKQQQLRSPHLAMLLAKWKGGHSAGRWLQLSKTRVCVGGTKLEIATLYIYITTIYGIID